jgi:fatty-acyl-CoA synthase
MKPIPPSEELHARAQRLAGRFGNEAYYLGACFRSGMFGIEPPRRLAQIARAFNDYGMLGAGVAAAAIRHPDQLAVIDDAGELTYRELDDSVNAIATAWLERGLKAGDGVAIMARNHRGFLQALFAAARCGARIVLMNTGFSAPQVREVATREGVDLFVYDQEFEPLIAELELPRRPLDGRRSPLAPRAW